MNSFYIYIYIYRERERERERNYVNPVIKFNYEKIRLQMLDLTTYSQTKSTFPT